MIIRVHFGFNQVDVFIKKNVISSFPIWLYMYVKTHCHATTTNTELRSANKITYLKKIPPQDYSHYIIFHAIVWFLNNTGLSLSQSGCIIGHGWIWITKWGLPKEQSLFAFDQEYSDKDMLTNNTAGRKVMTNSSSMTPVYLIYIDSQNTWTYFICVGFRFTVNITIFISL